MYSMGDLSSRVKKTPQALYSLIKQNSALSSIVKENSERKGRYVRYGEPVLEWLLNYYGESLQEDTNQEDRPEPPETPLKSVSEPAEQIDQTETIKALQAQIEALNASITAKNMEIEYFKEQNNRLLLLLQMEKQEKVALLPAPKKSFVERIRTSFTNIKNKKAPSE